MPNSSPTATDHPEDRQRALERLVASDGWQHVMEHVLSTQINLDAVGMNWEISPDLRAHVQSQRSTYLAFIRWVYTEAQVDHPWDAALAATYGRLERKSRAPQEHRAQPDDAFIQALPGRSRRGAGIVA